MPTLQREGGRVCAFLSQAQLDAMPNLQFRLRRRQQAFAHRAHQYMVEFPRASPITARFGMSAASTKHYCVAVFDNQRGGTVIGASIMRQREVIFDIVNSMITFVDADCDKITPATSHLRDAYAFAPCPRLPVRVPRRLQGARSRVPVHSWNHRGATREGWRRRT